MNSESSSYNDILKSIHPVVTLSRAFGVMPLSYNSVKRLCLSRVGIIYSSVVFVIFTLHAVVMPVYVIHLNLPGQSEMYTVKNTMSRVIDILQGRINILADSKSTVQTLAMKILNPILLSLMGMSAHWIALSKLSEDFPKIIEDLSKADVFLRTKFSLDYALLNRKQLHYCLLSVTIFITLGVTINGYYISVVWMTWGVSVTLFWCMLLSLANVTAMVTELQFTNLVNLLTVRFETLNRQIHNYIEEKRSSNFFYRYKTMANFKRSKKVMPMPLSDNFLLADLGITKTDVPLATMMESSRRFHNDLCNLITSVNELYQLQLLCSLVTCFIRAVLNFYFCIFGYSSTTGSPSYSHEFPGFFSLICWSAFYTLRFINLVLSADKMTHEAKKAKPVAAAINNRFLDSESKDELLLFSNYMASCKVEFTANGFFTLNSHLITSAIGAGTTYLVILVQFQAN